MTTTISRETTTQQPEHRPRGRVLRGAVLAIIVAAVLAPTTPARADDGDGDPKKQEVTLLTASGKTSEKENFPKKLEKYRKSLLRIANDFTLHGTKTETLEPKKTTKVTLPKKLGDAKITWDGKTATIEVEKDGKVIAKIKTNTFPAYLVDDSIKINGEQVVLILDKAKK